MEYKVYVGDTPLIKVDCVADLDTASGVFIKYKKPVSGTTGSWTGTVTNDVNSGKGRYVEYQAQVTDLDEPGDWRFQSYIVFNDGTRFYGETARQTVFDLFDA